jgi:hypothetical protein
MGLSDQDNGGFIESDIESDAEPTRFVAAGVTH